MRRSSPTRKFGGALAMGVVVAIISNEAIVVGRHSQPGQTQIEEEGCKSAPKARSPIGISTATSANVSAKSKWVDGWKIKSWADWIIAWTSFAVFVTLEAAVLYSYCVFLRIIH